MRQIWRGTESVCLLKLNEMMAGNMGRIKGAAEVGRRKGGIVAMNDDREEKKNLLWLYFSRGDNEDACSTTEKVWRWCLTWHWKYLDQTTRIYTFSLLCRRRNLFSLNTEELTSLFSLFSRATSWKVKSVQSKFSCRRFMDAKDDETTFSCYSVVTAENRAVTHNSLAI